MLDNFRPMAIGLLLFFGGLIFLPIGFGIIHMIFDYLDSQLFAGSYIIIPLIIGFLLSDFK